MNSVGDEARELLLTRLSAVDEISEADRNLLDGLSWRIEEKSARTQFVDEGDRPSECCLVISGIVVRSRYTQDGQRQILSVHIPGDIPDLQSLHLKRMDHGLETVGPCRLAFVSHSSLHDVCRASYSVAAAIWRESLIDGALHRAAIFRNGRLEADARLAHFISEMYLRHLVLGMATDGAFQFPLSQEMMGEALGLTVVSINRAAQTLRARGLVRMERGSIQVLDPGTLAAFGQFDPTFLHVRDEFLG